MRAFILCLATSVLSATPAFACSKDAPTARLPGFTDDQMWKRAYAMWKDWDTISDYNRAKALHQEASTVYLAQIQSSADIPGQYTTRSLIVPLAAVKGELPKKPVSLVGYMRDSCDGANGDGDGAYASRGEWIVVYSGVSKRANRPNGIDSLIYKDIRDIEVLDAVEAWLKTKSNYKPFD